MALKLSQAHLAQASVLVDYCTNTRPSWRITERAVERACKVLGVRRPVHIYLSESRRGRWAGSHAWDERRERHTIMVARPLRAADVSRTLWHELTHAAQHERGDTLDAGISSSRRARLAPDAYRTLPGEREAALNERYAETYPLVRVPSSGGPR